jgi:DNA-binding transcriptional LysR family regulator
MELSDLNVFMKVVQCNSISGAAAQLNRVPSNVTARIKSLEEKLGKDLFVREKNRLRISPAGELLLPYAKQLLALSDQAKDALTDNQPSGHLRVGTMEAVAATRLVEPLKQFHQAFPQVQLEIKTAPTGDLIDRVLAGEIDVALVADCSDDKRLVQSAVFEEELVIVSDLSHAPINEVNDLGIDPCFIGFSASCAYRNKMTQWIKSAGQRVKVIEISSYHTLLSCVAAGMGVGIVPRALLASYPFHESIQVHVLSKQWQRSITSIIWREDSVKPSIIAFSQAVKGTLDR